MKKHPSLAVIAAIMPLLAACNGEEIPNPTPNPEPSGQTWSVAGSVQKGPFTQGTSITIQALDTSLNPTGSQYQTKTTDDAGSFGIDSQIGSKLVEIIASGYYFNEIEGKVSSSTLTLRSLSDLSEEGKTNVNLLTTLESDRMRTLVKEGKSIAEARTQAENEIFAVFNIPVSAGAVANFDKMDITGGATADAILLAISASLQAGRSVGELSELISKIAGDIASNGTLVTESLRSQITEGCMKVNADEVRSNLEKRYTALGIADFTIPPFEDYLDINGNGVIDKDDSWIILGQSDFVISDKGGSFDITLQHSKEFEVIVDESWVRRTDPTKAYLEDAVLHFEVDPNEDVEARYALIRIKDSESSYYESVTLTQKQKDALTLAKESVELEKEAGSFEVQFSHNAEVNIYIDTDWIHQVSTKALTTSTASFSVDANLETETRTGHVTFTLGELSETLTVYQKGGRTIVLSGKEINLSSDASQVYVRVTANVDFDVYGPDADWISLKADNVTKAVVKHSYTYTVEENLTGSSRQAAITFKDTGSDLSETVTITQAQNNVLSGEKSEYRVSYEGGTVEIPISTNLEYTASIEQEGDWLSIVQTKAVRSETIVLKAAKNEDISPRSATLKLTSDSGSAAFTIIQGANAEQVTVTVKTPGTLTQEMSEDDLHKVLNLKIVGTLNDDDLAVLTGGVWVGQGAWIGSDPAHIECDWATELLDLSEMKTESSAIGVSHDFFCCMTSLLEVRMPLEVETVGSNSFNRCPNLSVIDWGEDSSVSTICGGINANAIVGYIGYYGAFKDCVSIESVTLPASVSDFQAGAFSNCLALKTLSFTDGGKLKELHRSSISYVSGGFSGNVVTHIMGQLWGCSSLETIVLPSNLREIGSDAFYGTPFRTISIPSTVKYLTTEYLFADCYRLEEVTLPSTITEYSKEMFSGCESLNSITGPSKITKYCEGCFKGCPTKWIILDPEAEYEGGVFAGMDVESVSFPAGFKTVPERMFQLCTKLGSLSLGEVESIGSEAFYGCSALESVTIPAGVRSVGSYAFGYCDALASVRVEGESIRFNTAFSSDMNPTVTIGKTVRSIAGELGSGISEIVFEDGSVCENFASARGSKSLKSIALPSSLKTVGDSAFYYCTALESIDIPAGVISIGANAFDNCKALAGISLHDGLEDIGSKAFFYCSALESVTIPYTVAGIGKRAFRYNHYLEEVHMKSIDPPYIGDDVFSDCKYLEKIQVPDEGLSDYKSAWSDYADIIVGGEEGGAYRGTSSTASVSTLDASKVAFVNAQLNGQVNIPASMSGLSTRVFFYYSDYYSTAEDLKSSGNYYNASSYLQGDGTFSAYLGVTSGKTYHYIACAKVGNDEYIGEVKSFTTGSITSDEATVSVATLSATLNGTLSIPESLSGETPELYFLYGESESMSDLLGSGTKAAASVEAEGSFHATVSGLSPGTVYYYIACVKIGDTVAYGEVKSFAMLTMTVTTEKASVSISESSAVLNGTIALDVNPYASGLSAEVLFVYCANNISFETADGVVSTEVTTLEELLEYGTKVEAFWSDGEDESSWVKGSGSLKATVYGLEANTEYLYVAYANVAGMESYGDIVRFSTAYNFPDGPVDLGLSVKWSSCNLGASAPEEYGTYYPWETVLSEGRMPTADEWSELSESCTWTWTERNGVAGCTVAGSNGNAIFLPAAGEKQDGSYDTGVGSHCFYWSATTSSDTYAKNFHAYSPVRRRGLQNTGRDWLLSIRPVYE